MLVDYMCSIDINCIFNNPYKNNVDMKANEVPEKIFLEWYSIGDKKYRDWCIIPKTNDEPVEYTRTDAFIEKAKKWFEKRNEWFDIDGSRHCDMESFEDFVNYMKGE